MAVQVEKNVVENVELQTSKVSLSLENCILPPNKLSPTPSFIDGLDPESEIDLRILGCEMVQVSGTLLKLPQVAMATGQVLFQRFFYSKSFVRQQMEVVAMACITLASKIEEAPRRIRDVINVCHHIKQIKAGKTISPLILDQNYINLKNQVIKAERRVLKELGFCVHVKHPHKIIVTLLEVLKVSKKQLMQTAWNYMNDSLRTEVFLRYCPEKIACACIHLSARVLQIPLPNKPAWYLVFGVSDEEITDISRIILSFYSRKKPDPEKLEKLIEQLKKTHQEAKLKAKGISLNNVLVNSSPIQMDSPRNGTRSPASDRKKEKSEKQNDVSPKHHKEANHRKRKSVSPAEDGQSPKKRGKSSSSGGSSASSSPRRKGKTPPRGFKDSHRSRSRSRSKPRTTSKPKKHRSSHKRKRSHTTSPTALSPATHHSSKKSYKSKHSDKSRSARSRSRSHERSNHHSNSVHEKSSHKSRRDRTKENHHSSSRDKKRR